LRALVGLGVIALLGGAIAYYWLGARVAGPGAPVPARTADRAPEGISSPPVPADRVASPPAGDAGAVGAASETRPPGTSASAPAEEGAKAYVRSLTDTGASSLPVTAADHFVSGNRRIGLDSGKIIEELTLGELKLDRELRPDSPITVVKGVSQIELASPEKLIADAGGDLDQEIQVLVDDHVETRSVREVLARHADAAGPSISVVKVIDYLQPTTLAELLADAGESGLGWDDMIRVIKGRYRAEAATVADLLAGIEGVREDSIFYVHSVRPTDTQGVWGIIHRGLIDNFARGMAVRRGENVETFRVEIPRDADERRDDHSSSFLGKLIDEKSSTSAVYNFRAGRMTRNPDHIVPGSEIVIINFSPDELVSIYQHFLRLRAHAT